MYSFLGGVQARLRRESAVGQLRGWRLLPVIVKTCDDLRQVHTLPLPPLSLSRHSLSYPSFTHMCPAPPHLPPISPTSLSSSHAPPCRPAPPGQEQCAAQLISQMHQILLAGGCESWLRPYDIIALSEDEVIPR